MPTRPTRARETYLQALLAEFSRTFAAASPEHPNVRCVTRVSLVRTLNAIRDQLAIPGYKQISGEKVLEDLRTRGLVHPLPVMDPDHGEPLDKLYTIGLGGSSPSVNPIEILQAIEPNGVICYFTALQFHELTTQVSPHHHIGRLVIKERSANSIPRSGDHPQKQRRERASPDPLGTIQFLYGGVPYYVTTRDKRRVPGYQSRYLSNSTIFNITTYEQTLLDTVHRPLNCGGPAVVFEAWERALSELDDARLLSYLREINDPKLTRRVGYILTAVLQHEPSDELDSYLSQTCARSLSVDSPDYIPLLPGVRYSQTDDRWRLEVP